jgi:hypothetical protein
LLAAWLTFFTVKAVPLSLTSWYTGRAILVQLIPLAVAIIGHVGDRFGPKLAEP